MAPVQTPPQQSALPPQTTLLGRGVYANGFIPGLQTMQGSPVWADPAATQLPAIKQKPGPGMRLQEGGLSMHMLIAQEGGSGHGLPEP